MEWKGIRASTAACANLAALSVMELLLEKMLLAGLAAPSLLPQGGFSWHIIFLSGVFQHMLGVGVGSALDFQLDC